MDRDYPPLSASCVKNLVDKLFDKRKLALAEIERLTKESFAQDRCADVFKLIGYFSHDFIMSPNPNSRKGGLLGLASVAIGLSQYAGQFYKSIVPPVLRTFQDDDSQVRYCACETLYNIMKITRKETLYLLSEVFDAVSRGISDPDLSVRQGAVQCDRLLKEIVTEPDFVNLSVVVSLLRERMYTNNPFARQFIVSWTNTLYAVPGMKISTYLPQLLDGLFRILGDPNADIRRQCEILLNDLLNEILANPSDICFSSMINILLVHCRLSTCSTSEHVNRYTLQTHTVAEDAETVSPVLDSSNQTNFGQNSTLVPTSGELLKQRTALTWIRAFVELDPEHLLPFASGIIGAVLPCFLALSATDPNRDDLATLETAVRINDTLLKYVRTVNTTDRVQMAAAVAGDTANSLLPLKDDFTSHSSDYIPADVLHSSSQSAERPADGAFKQPISSPLVCADAILDATCRLLEHQSLLTRLAALHWIEVLGKVNPTDVVSHVVRLLPLMLNLLADPSPDMVHSVVRLIGNLCNHPETVDCFDRPGLVDLMNIPAELGCLFQDRVSCRSDSGGQNERILRERKSVTHAYGNRNPFCLRFLINLVQFFDRNTTVLAHRGDMIITDLCEVIGAEIVYSLLSSIISRASELRSASVLVRALNRILLTQPSLHGLRCRLRSVNTEDGCRLLERLFRAWCHNPVALLSLYMFTQNYRQSNRLIKSFGEISLTVDTLVEMDQLIQMIESPIFATLRMHLLDKRYSADLRETLYCLLMCLPQTEAFHTLWRRLQCVPTVDNLSDWPVASGHPQPNVQLMDTCITFDALFEHFHALQKRCSPLRSSGTKDTKGIDNEPCTGPFLNGSRSSVNEVPPVARGLNRTGETIGSAEAYLSQSLAKLGIHVPDTGAPS